MRWVGLWVGLSVSRAFVLPTSDPDSGALVQEGALCSARRLLCQAKLFVPLWPRQHNTRDSLPFTTTEFRCILCKHPASKTTFPKPS